MYFFIIWSTDPAYWMHNVKNLMWLRNHIVVSILIIFDCLSINYIFINVYNDSLVLVLIFFLTFEHIGMWLTIAVGSIDFFSN